MQDTLQSTEISRRRLLISVAASTSLATCATQSAEAAIKVAQSTVHYQTTPRDGQSCGQCIQLCRGKPASWSTATSLQLVGANCG